MVAEALGRVVSERAAEQLLRAALRDAALTPEQVGAADMQRVLADTLERRLTSVMPTLRAHDELRRLATRLQQSFPRAPTLFPDAQPVASVASWAAGAGATNVLVPEKRQQNAMPDAFGELLSIETEAQTSRADVPTVLNADDFELDDLELHAPGPDGPGAPARTAPFRAVQLRETNGQDALLSDLAKLGSVRGVVLCDAAGKVVRARSQTGADALGAMMAATAALFRGRPWHILCVDLGAQTVCVRPLGNHFVALLAGSNVNLGRLIAELSSLKESA